MRPLSDIRLQAIVLLAGLVLMGIKFVAWRATQSNAILSDALESIVNVVAGAFALYALVLAAKPRDRDHPYGHGKVEFISAGIEGGLVGIAGIAIVIGAVLALIKGHTVRELDVGIVLTAVAGGLNVLMGLVLKRRGRKARSITMEASGTHLLSDAWSTLAMLVSLALVRITGLQWLDSLFALGFAGIMDETDRDAAGELVSLIEAHRRPQWVDLHNFRVIQFGRTLHIDCHVTLPWYYTLERAHEEIAAIERLVNEQGACDVELFIHMDPCIPASCTICALEGCPQRKAAQARRVTWSLETVLGNAKHGAV